MNLFSELYNCYYQITVRILEKASQAPLTRQQIYQLAAADGGPESALAIVSQLLDGDWKLLADTGSGKYKSILCRPPRMPFTALQKSWLKSLLSDQRIALFFSDEQLSKLEELLKDVKPLFRPADFQYFDRYRDQDPVQSPMYRRHFAAILNAMDAGQWLRITYYSGKEHWLERTYLPSRLEYSPKDGKFRLCAFYRQTGKRWRLDVLNVARILKIEPIKLPKKDGPNAAAECQTSTACQKTPAVSPDIDCWLEDSLSKEPVVLEILDERNALERTMLHFASYQRSVERIGNGKCYRCSIYYDKRWETELLIQVLSFGPMVKVLGPEHFLAQMKERINKQALNQKRRDG